MSRHLLLLLLGLLVACPDSPSGPDVGSSPVDGGALPQATVGEVTGRVLELGTLKPLAGVVVQLGGATGTSRTTTTEGRFTFTELVQGQTIVLVARREGYAEAFVAVRVQAGRVVEQDFRLAPVQARAVFEAATGGEVASGQGAAARFPAGSVVDAAGKPVSGPVVATLTALDPSTDEGLSAFPGSFDARLADGSPVLLETIVPMEVRLEQDGQRLNLGGGKAAELALPIPAALEGRAPETIALWSLDEQTGVWKQEGTARREALAGSPGRFVYRAQIGHLSWWNADMAYGGSAASAGCASGCVKDSSGNPVPGLTVVAQGLDYLGRSVATTDASGCFSVIVRALSRVRVFVQPVTGAVGGSVVVDTPAGGAACVAVNGLTATPQRPAPTLRGIAIVPKMLNLAEGTTAPLFVVGDWSDGEPHPVPGVTWSSDDPNAVSIDAATGEVTAVGMTGIATITASVADPPLSATSHVGIVSALFASYTTEVTPNPVTLQPGEQTALTATLVFGDGTRSDVTPVARWQSANLRVVSTDTVGRVTGVGPGSALVSAGYLGRTGSTWATVLAPPDAGTPDTGGAPDVGAPDTGGSPGSPDAGPPDTGGSPGSPDVGTSDTGGSPGSPDVGTPDVGATDAGSLADTGPTPDASSPADASSSDTGVAVWSGPTWNGTTYQGGKSCNELGCWENPMPTGLNLADIGGSGPNDLWAVGANGVALHWNGSDWRPFPTGVVEILTAVWAAGPSDVWAVGDKGDVLHWNGTAWALDLNVFSTKALHLVWGTAWNDVWIGGDDNALFHFDGASWTQPMLPACPASNCRISALGGTGPSDVWAVGEKDGSIAAQVLHWNGTAWSAVTPPSTGALRAVWATATNDVLVAGSDVFRWGGTSWQSLGAAPSMYVGLRSFGPTSIVALKNWGPPQVWDGASWTEASCTTGTFATHSTQGIWASAVNDLWVVGSAGGIWRWNGTSWNQASQNLTGTPENIVGVWASSPTDGWAVSSGGAAGGALLHTDGTGWSVVSRATGRLTAIGGSGASDVWVGGNYAVLSRWNGTSWTSVDNWLPAGYVASDEHVVSIAAIAPNDVWVSAQHLFHFDGTTWTAATTVTRTSLALWANSTNDVWAVGSGGVTLHWNGSTWTDVPTGEFQPFSAVWGAGPNDVWAVGPTGVSYHWDGAQWNAIQGIGAWAVWGTSSQDVWLGQGSEVYRYDGRAWSPPLGGWAMGNIRAGKAFPGGGGWIVGSNSMLLELW